MQFVSFILHYTRQKWLMFHIPPKWLQQICKYGKYTN